MLYLSTFLLATLTTPTTGFAPINKNVYKTITTTNLSSPNTTPTSSALYSSSSFTNPSQEKSVELGIREWPQQTKSQSTWDEEVKDNETKIRYILQGDGELIINNDKAKKFSSGVLIEVNGPANLNWVKKSDDDVIILTPGYEQGGQLIGVGVAFIVLCGALIAGVGN